MSASLNAHRGQHLRSVQNNPMLPPPRDLIRIGSRRWFLQTGLAGLAGLSLADQLKLQAAESTGASASGDRKSVILFWLSGGPSQIDMWDPKPDAPTEFRGPYRSIPTAVPGGHFSEHLPRQAKLLDKIAVIRSVDCSASNHTPITMQAGNTLARRTDDGRDGAGYPSMGSIAAKFRGSNVPGMPPFVGLADSWKADVWGAGHMGSQYEPVQGKELPGRLSMPEGVSVERLQNRRELSRQFDRLKRDLDQPGNIGKIDQFQEMALDMVVSGRVERAFDLDQEPDKIRDAYGRTSIGEKGLLARRLVEAGTTFVLVSGAWGYFDHHGDEVRWGGIQKGLTPLLPRVDQVIDALVHDLQDRGLLDSTLVLMMGEFGRSPVMTKTNGRGHWTPAMSMLAFGGGIPGGTVIGSTDRRGGAIVSDRVMPADLAATVFRHLDIPLDTHWVNPQGRPIPIVTEGGRPVPGLI